MESNWMRIVCTQIDHIMSFAIGSVILYSLQCLCVVACCVELCLVLVFFFSVILSCPFWSFARFYFFSLVGVCGLPVSTLMHQMRKDRTAKTFSLPFLWFGLLCVICVFFYSSFLARDKTFSRHTNLTGFELYFDCLLQSHKDCLARSIPPKCLE